MRTDGHLPDWVDRLAAGFCIIDADSHLRFVNRTLADWLGASGSELTGRVCHEALDLTSCGTALCPLSRILDGADAVGPVPIGGKCCPDGCPGALTAWAVRSEEGHVSHIVAQVSKAAPWTLAAFTYMDRMAMMLYDREGSVLWAWSAGLEASLGFRTADVIGGRMTDFLPDELGASRLARLREVVEHNSPTYDEFATPTPNGERWLGVSLIPITQGLGESPLVLSIARDITERKQAERTLQRKNVALQEVLGSIEDAKTQMGRNIQASLDRLVRPLLRDIQGRLAAADAPLADVLEGHLREICSPYASRLSQGVTGLTPSEMRIAGLIRAGMASKQIARLEHISTATVNKHREHIRHKLGISGKHINLAGYLQSLAGGQSENPHDQTSRHLPQAASPS